MARLNLRSTTPTGFVLIASKINVSLERDALGIASTTFSFLNINSKYWEILGEKCPCLFYEPVEKVTSQTERAMWLSGEERSEKKRASPMPWRVTGVFKAQRRAYRMPWDGWCELDCWEFTEEGHVGPRCFSRTWMFTGRRAVTCCKAGSEAGVTCAVCLCLRWWQ